MQIRKATMNDLPDILAIYAYARKYMKEHGIDEIVVHAPYIINLGNSVKPETFSLATQDIQSDCLYVCIIQIEEDEQIGGVFYFHREEDPDYQTIDGSWLNDRPYAVVHRVATAPGTKGVATFCLNWAYEQFPNIKIDTHDDNIPMQHLLVKLGFTCCGHTTLQNGDIRLIYQKAD